MIELTYQKVFDKVANHLRKQGGRSFDEGFCRLRDNQGRSCAIGCMIPDKIYTRVMEEIALVNLFHSDECLSYLKPFDGLLFALQDIHDNPTNWDSLAGFNLDGEHALHRIAQLNELQYPETPNE